MAITNEFGNILFDVYFRFIAELVPISIWMQRAVVSAYHAYMVGCLG